MPRAATAKKSSLPRKAPTKKSAPTKRASAGRARSKEIEQPAPVIVRHDLLDEPLLGVQTGGGRGAASLPQVLAALGENDVRAFTGLQAHQQHAWHAFLVQLATIALHRVGKTDPRQGASSWRKMLLELTDGRREPWCLLVSDLSQPAFMQPPVPEETLDGFQPPLARPDKIDVLVTSKNHDVKAARIGAPRPEHWVYALVSLQTMQGFSGRDNYGIARMNSGAGSRPGVGLAPGLLLGARFVRDALAILESRDQVVEAFRYADRDGIGLQWLHPWDGTKRLAVRALDPSFIEICRRMRIVQHAAALAVRFKPTPSERTAADELKGNTGDAWTPIMKAEAKAFTAADGGFSYRVMQRLLGDEFEPGAALLPRRGEKELLLIAAVLARGQGKTSGYHTRSLPVPAKVVPFLRSAAGRAELAKIASDRIKAVDLARRSVLNPAILVLLQGSPERLDFQDDRARSWVDRLDNQVDVDFFERLWADLDADPDAARARWERHLVELARAQLRDAIESAPMPEARRYRCIAAAERVLEGAARKHLSNAFAEEVSREQHP